MGQQFLGRVGRVSQRSHIGESATGHSNDLGGRWGRIGRVPSPRLDIYNAADLEVGHEATGAPEIFVGAEPPSSFLAMVHASIPATGWFEARSAHAVRALEHKAVVRVFDVRVGPFKPFAVHIAPRAEGGELQSHVGLSPSQETVRNTSCWPSVRHGDLGLHDDRSYRPSPTWRTVGQCEVGQIAMAVRSDRSVRPLVGCQFDTSPADNQHRIERRKTEVTPGRGSRGRDE